MNEIISLRTFDLDNLQNKADYHLVRRYSEHFDQINLEINKAD